MHIVDAILSPVLLILGWSGMGAGTARVIKHRTTEGLSMVSTQLGLLANGTWVAYGIVHHIPLQVMNNLPTGLMAFVIMFTAWRSGRLNKPHMAVGWTIVYGCLAAYLIVVLGLAAMSVILTVLSVVNRMPQIVESWRNPGGEGLSIPSYGLLIAGTGGWLGHGMLHQEGAVIASSSWTVLALSFILFRTLQARRVAVRAANREAIAFAIQVA